MAPQIGFDAVRREQMSEGARMAREEGRGPGVIEQRHGKRTMHVTAKKAAPKGHEAFLKQLEASSAKIEIVERSSGDKVSGTIKCSDKYTITLRVQEDSEFRDWVYFKHDLSKFRSLSPRPDREVTGDEVAQ